MGSLYYNWYFQQVKPIFLDFSVAKPPPSFCLKMTDIIFGQPNFNRRCVKFYVERCYLKGALSGHPSGYFYMEIMAEKEER